MRWSVRLVNGAIALALVVVFLGGWTRLNDAGLGCPDWPTCYGHFVLPAHDQVAERIEVHFPGHQVDLDKGWLEMIHRYAASALGLLILIQAIWGWRQRGRTGYPIQLTLALLALVIVQGIFGMWTVTLKLVPWVVTLHLLGGLTTLVLLVRLRQRLASVSHSGRRYPGQEGKVMEPSVAMLLAVIFMQIALGGWTSSNYAGWACDHWASCHRGEATELDFMQGFNPVLPLGPNYEGGLLPASARAAIQMVHRAGAVAVVLALAFVSWRLRNYRHLLPWVCLCWGAVGMQVVLGVLNVVWQLPLGLAIAHHAGGVVILLSVMGLYDRSFLQRVEVTHVNHLPTGQVSG
ncbi:Heme A synthase, cytochrome oxidase biogenesis protein Cox15-CtaA [Marinobacterium lacunae]|uniref:Heme A synthase, cytochrome oxidase biogenesis protein Cox15-CtaA n=1 Tax=Marinobacterium lacunae TaxID=1232683 RepID=A0A081FWR5_9GAMM|nr:COX15/CtaA family protein [Marinobacterium lacunae]KEA62970.1 Heme A synthase, cytochrome oxidase biogenesis protein Cox15-CtaA [Marinobacterium lacunae]